MNEAYQDTVLYALDGSLDAFGPLAKEAFLAALRQRFPGGGHSIEQVEEFMIETWGSSAGKMLARRFRKELDFTHAGRK